MTCWIPNLLTLSRLVLLVPLLWLLDAGTAPFWSFGLFLAASLTDALDGYAARRLGCAGNLGTFLDPLADKVFANVLLVWLSCHHPDWIPLWAVLLLLAREFAVQGFRSMAPCLGVVISTGQLNKWKLVFQLIAVGTTLVGLGWPDAVGILRPPTWLALALALVTGLWSMLTLFLDNHDLWRRAAVEMERR
ncbi:MAG: CDP-diacylglycerol--glycerol-3-phosphate 3-phosphatidyltransferase [Pseudomonadota bacterium]